MIIFDLDGTLADCEHRRHFVHAAKNSEYEFIKFNFQTGELAGYKSKVTGYRFQPNWHAFYEACDQDKTIEPVADVFRQLSLRWPENTNEIQIWSGRCESVREKTLKWLIDNVGFAFYDDSKLPVLKMRPIGATLTVDDFKERWLNEALAQGKKIDFVFDSDPESIKMWRRRGIFVFNVCQHDGET